MEGDIGTLQGETRVRVGARVESLVRRDENTNKRDELRDCLDPNPVLPSDRAPVLHARTASCGRVVTLLPIRGLEGGAKEERA